MFNKLMISFALLALVGCKDNNNGNEDMGSDTTTPATDTGVNLDSGLALDAELDQGARGPTQVLLGEEDDLKAPAAYAIMSKTGITNVTGSTITGGHLGVSPAAASYITGFSLVADASNEFATSASVTPPSKVYASDYAAPTPLNLTDAVEYMGLAYTDAAGRTNPDHLDLSDGNLGGLTLEPGLYRWGSSVTIPTNVTLAGGPEAVWIFQITNDLDLSAGQRVILSGGADAGRVFWQVSGEVVIRENAHFEGIILSQTGVTLQTNATMVGRILAQTLVALDDNTITTP